MLTKVHEDEEKVENENELYNPEKLSHLIVRFSALFFCCHQHHYLPENVRMSDVEKLKKIIKGLKKELKKN